MPRLLLTAALLSSAATTLNAQSPDWGITAEIGQSWFGGGARRDSAGTDYLQPSPSRFASLRIDRSGNRLAIGVTILYEKTGLRDATEEADITFHDLATLYSLRPELSTRILGLGHTRLDAHLGAGVEYWQFSGEDSRVRIGMLGGLTLVAPLGGAFAFRLRWEGGLSGSVFQEGELPAAFELRTSFHSRIGLGIRLGL